MFTLKKLGLSIIILLTATIHSSGQRSTSVNDSLSCYTNKELKVILKQVLKANELDTLYKIQTKQIEYLNTVISDKSEQIVNYVLIEKQKDYQLELRDKVIEQKNNDINIRDKEIKRQKVLKWSGISIFLATTIYFIIN